MWSALLQHFCNSTFNKGPRCCFWASCWGDAEGHEDGWLVTAQLPKMGAQGDCHCLSNHGAKDWGYAGKYYRHFVGVCPFSWCALPVRCLSDPCAYCGTSLVSCLSSGVCGPLWLVADHSERCESGASAIKGRSIIIVILLRLELLYLLGLVALGRDGAELSGCSSSAMLYCFDCGHHGGCQYSIYGLVGPFAMFAVAQAQRKELASHICRGAVRLPCRLWLSLWILLWHF